MKTIICILGVIFFQNYVNIQTSFSQNSAKQQDTLNNDLLLVKPLINFNDTNGGYYSDYYIYSLNKIFCGAIVKNIGNSNATNVYLEINFLEYDNSILATYYSDTITTLNSFQIDTIKVSQEILSNYWGFKILYKLVSDSIDENGVNNIDTLPYTALYDNMWSYASRANVPTNTININQIDNFQSRDFIGMTLKIPVSNWTVIAGMAVYINETWADSLYLIGKIYQDGVLIDSMTIDNQGLNQPYWAYSQFNYLYDNGIVPESIYYIGVELIYPDGTNIPIGVDTSSFHNFEAETIARIGNTWTTLNFVPLIQLICDPEQIQKLNIKNHVNIFPNPSNGIVKITGVDKSKIEIYNLIGKLLFSDYCTSYSKSIDLSSYSQGNYIVRVINEQGVINNKITIVN